MALTVLKRTPIHVVVSVSGVSASETIDLDVTLPTSTQSPTAPVVNITSVYWAVPAGGNATITRNSVPLWVLPGSHDFQFNGFSDNRENTSDIVVTTPSGGGTVIIEMVKVSGYGDTQHVNPLT